jgi:hypothetical protein
MSLKTGTPPKWDCAILYVITLRAPPTNGGVGWTVVMRLGGPGG